MQHTTKTHLEPTEIGPDTFLIHDHQGEGTAPVTIGLNSMVIRGREPVVVDTGMAENRDQWMADVFGLVEPEDIRWLVISHDDVDHTGNLNALMDAAPNATLVINWFMMERMGASLQVSPMRQRWLADGDRLDVGDRVLQLVRPPIFDSPTTRGVFDPTTGIYWASDAFATPMPPTPVRAVNAIDRDMWVEGRAMFDNYVSPWLSLVDDARFQATVDRVESLRPTTIVGCHTPVIGTTWVARAIASVRRSPTATFTPEPDQTTLDLIQATLSSEPTEATSAAETAA